MTQEDSGSQDHMQRNSGFAGENLFAGLLSADGILGRCVSFWSLWSVTDGGQKELEKAADVDCILKFGSHIIVVDVKNWISDVTWHSLIPGRVCFCTNSNTSRTFVLDDPMDKDRKRRHNETMSTARVQRNLQQYLAENGSPCSVESFIVLVPGRNGESKVDRDVYWPGNIPVLSYDDFVMMLNNRAKEDAANYGSCPAERTPEEIFLATLVRRKKG